MQVAMIYRLLLLALLPVIALLVYVESRDYDPALIQFQQEALPSDPMEDFAPENIGPFVRMGSLRVFTRDNLWEYVNGHAEYYISQGFKRLAVGDYALGESEKDQSDALVAIFDMQKAIQAFGVFSDELTDESTTLDTEIQTPQGVTFIKGPYLVKILMYNDKASPDTIKDHISRQIGPETGQLNAFSGLPQIGGIAQTSFFKESYRGLEFLNNVLERKYRINEKSCTIALFTEDPIQIKTLTKTFVDFFQDSEIEYSTEEISGKKIYKISDPYEGDWVLMEHEKALLGVYGAVDDSIIEKIIQGKENKTTEP